MEAGAQEMQGSSVKATLGRKLGTLVETYRNKGLPSAADAVLKKLFPSGNSVLSWEARLLFRCSPGEPQPATARSASVLSDSAVDRLIERYGKNRKAVLAALRKGEKCWAIKSGDEVVAYVWIREERGRLESDTAFQMDIPGRLAYWWRDVFVHPAHRGKGLLQALLYSWAASRSPAGREPIYTEIAPRDLRSIKAHTRLGFRQIGQLYTLCVLGARIFFFRTPESTGVYFRYFPHNIYYYHPGTRKLFFKELQE